MKAFPWENAMRFGLGNLGLSPRQFWAMTPRELSLAYEAIAQTNQSNTPIAHDELRGLMARFPDKET